MLRGMNPIDGLITATRESEAWCPMCAQPLIPHCGQILIWHWAHASLIDCDTWSEPESEWHLGWKRNAPSNQVEQTLELNGEKHRADMVTSNGTVIELQHSSISVEEIRERERFYGRFHEMIWLFNAGRWRQNIEIRCKRPGQGYVTFRWRWPRKSIWHCRAPVYFDLDGIMLFEVRKIYHDTPCGGWGRLHTRDSFLQRFLGKDT